MKDEVEWEGDLHYLYEWAKERQPEKGKKMGLFSKLKEKKSREKAQKYLEQNHTSAYEGYGQDVKGIIPGQKRDDVSIEEAPLDDNLLKLAGTKGFDPDMPIEERLELSAKKDDEIHKKAKKTAKRLKL